MRPKVGVNIRGTGSFVPRQVMTNTDFTRFLDTNDEWIRSRTGIKERRIAAPEESTASLGIEAARRALKGAGLSPTDLDLIICTTITPEMIFPSTACYIQAGLGCRSIGAFDLLAACSGFLYGMSVGAQFIEAGTYQHVLVVGAETLSRVTDYTDRGSCILFGDGAGAVVLSAETEPGRGLRGFRLHSEGARSDLMSLPGGGSRYPASLQTVAERKHYMRLNGREVYKFVVTRMQELITDAMTEHGLTNDDVALIIPHQVNQRIIDAAVEHLDFPRDKVMVNIDRYGNTSSASIPMALDEAVRSGRAGRGDTVIFVAFGAGLTWASAVVTLGDINAGERALSRRDAA